jgi:hypothetical protein
MKNRLPIRKCRPQLFVVAAPPAVGKDGRASRGAA